MVLNETNVLTDSLEEAIAKQLHQSQVRRMVKDGFVLGEGGGRTSPLLKPYQDLDIKDRKHLRDKAALSILALERIGCSVNRFAEDESMDNLLKSVLAADLAKKRYEELHVSYKDEPIPFEAIDPDKRKRLIAETNELLSAIDAAGVGVKNDGRTEDVRRMELYYDWAKDSVGKENAIEMAVNYGISRGTSFDDVNVFIDVVNKNEGCNVEYYTLDDVASREYTVAENAFGLSYHDKVYETFETPLPSLLLDPFGGKTSQVKLESFLKNEQQSFESAVGTMASRISEIGHDQVRSVVTDKAIKGIAGIRREQQRLLLGYDLELKTAYDRFITTEKRYVESAKANTLYNNRPAIQRIFMKKPPEKVTEAERKEAKSNLEAVLADRIAIDGNKSLTRVDFGDATSLKTSVKANNFYADKPTVDLELMIYDGNLGWHQGFSISKNGDLENIRVGFPESEISVEQRYLAADRRPEMIQAQYRFEKVADMVRCAALEKFRIDKEPSQELPMDAEAFRQKVEEEAKRIKEEKLQKGDILDEVLTRKPEQEQEISDEILTAYVEDRATVEERKNVEKALEKDPQLRETLDVIRKIDGKEKSETKDLTEKEEDHPEIYTHLPGEISPRDYDMLIAYGISSKDIKKLGIDKKVSINQDVFVRETRPWDTTLPATRSVYIDLSLTSDNRVKISDPISGKDLGEAWQVLSSGKNLNFLQIHKDAEINRNNEKHVTTTVKLK